MRKYSTWILRLEEGGLGLLESLLSVPNTLEVEGVGLCPADQGQQGGEGHTQVR